MTALHTLHSFAHAWDDFVPPVRCRIPPKIRSFVTLGARSLDWYGGHGALDVYICDLSGWFIGVVSQSLSLCRVVMVRFRFYPFASAIERPIRATIGYRSRTVVDAKQCATAWVCAAVL